MEHATFEERTKFLDSEGLQFVPQSTFVSLAATMAPALTGPLVDTLKELIPWELLS